MKQAKQTFTCKCGKEYALVNVGATTIVIDERLVNKVVDAVTEATKDEM
jgi:hypothetical protein